MTSPPLAALVAPHRTALVVQEVQNGVVGDESAFPELADAAREAGMFDALPPLVDAARAAAVPVVHTTAENLPDGFGVNRNARLFAAARAAGATNAAGSRSVEPIPELGEWRRDLVLPRYHGLSPMTGGPLDALLRNAGITTIVVTGVSVNVAVTNIAMDAVNRGYQVVIPRDAVAGVPKAYGDAVLHGTLALLATLTDSAELLRIWSTSAAGGQAAPGAGGRHP